MKLPVNEIFETMQGEAKWTGTPSVFVRLQGCPVGCPWCDTKHTWYQHGSVQEITHLEMQNKSEDSDKYAVMEVDDLVVMILRYRAKHVVITGGEPAMYDLRELSNKLMAAGRTVQLETSGTSEIKIDPCAFVTVSPKCSMPGGLTVRWDAIDRADEIKHPVGKERDIENLKTLLTMYEVKNKPVWLQPLSQAEKATALCVEAATVNGWRVSIQVHKYMGVR